MRETTFQPVNRVWFFVCHRKFTFCVLHAFDVPKDCFSPTGQTLPDTLYYTTSFCSVFVRLTSEMSVVITLKVPPILSRHRFICWLMVVQATPTVVAAIQSEVMTCCSRVLSYWRSWGWNVSVGTAPVVTAHTFSRVIALLFFPFPAFDACEKSARPLKHNFLFHLLFILSGLLCVGKKIMTQGFWFCFSSALEIFFGTICIMERSTFLCPEWQEPLCKWDRKHNPGPDLTLLLVMTSPATAPN